MSSIAVAPLESNAVTDRDVAAVNALVQEFRPGARPLSHADLRVIATDTVLFIARNDDGRAVGMATLVVYRQTTALSGRVEDVIVTADYRGRGVGRLLMDALIKAARTRRLDHLNLTSNPRRIAAHGLYRSLGFQTRDTTVFRLTL